MGKKGKRVTESADKRNKLEGVMTRVAKYSYHAERKHNKQIFLAWIAAMKQKEEKDAKEDNNQQNPGTSDEKRTKKESSKYPYAFKNFRMLTCNNRKREAMENGRELEGKERRTLPLMSRFDAYNVLKKRLDQLHEFNPPHPDCPKHYTILGTWQCGTRQRDDGGEPGAPTSQRRLTYPVYHSLRAVWECLIAIILNISPNELPRNVVQV